MKMFIALILQMLEDEKGPEDFATSVCWNFMFYPAHTNLKLKENSGKSQAIS